VRNAQADSTAYDKARKNLTFVAVDVDEGQYQTYGQTAVSALRLFNGDSLKGDAATSLAEEMVPTGRVDIKPGGDTVVVQPGVFQVFTEAEVANIHVDPSGDAFPYGYVTRNPNDPSSRTLPGNPGEGQYDGVVTFAFKIPLQARANEDPFEITMMFKPMDDTTTRITQSLEEEGSEGQSSLRQRISALEAGGTTVHVTLLGNSDSPIIANPNVRRVCKERTAGEKGSATATLVDANNCTAGPVIFLAENNVTIKCLGLHFGGKGTINGITTYTKRKKENITGMMASQACTSGITNMYRMFAGRSPMQVSISDISSWDVSNVTNMDGMFMGDIRFLQDISSWDVSNVTSMNNMLKNTRYFNQDLSGWCVKSVTSHTNFAYNSGLTDDHKPVWSTCPDK
jgi:surface protein